MPTVLSQNARQPSRLLMAAWVLTLAFGVSSAVIVVSGARRDTRAGEPTISLSLGGASDWQTRAFRVWSDGRYRLLVSTVNFERGRVGSKFAGEMQVIVRRPDGTTLLEQRFGPETMDHRMPYNYGDTPLTIVSLERAWARPWTVAARVIRADPQFAGVASEVKLWREREDPGMGGMLTYVLIFPALILLLLSIVLGFVLARRGRRLPVVVSSGVLLVFLVLMA